MNILVTGGRGQLGSSLRKVSNEYPGHTFIFTDLPEGDITDRPRMERLIAESKADVIINCAAYTAVDKAESETAEAYKINVLGVRVLAGLAKECGIKLVHVSTDYVFDGTIPVPRKESDPTNPSGVYGLTKLEGEREIFGTQPDAVIVRTSWLYSEFGGNFVKTMLRLSETRSELGVVDDQTGSPTYAPDLARAIMTLADNGIRGVGVYHYSDAGEISWYDFAVKIFAIAGKDVNVRPITSAEYPAPAKRPTYSVLDTAKIREIGAIVPRWEDSLKLCISELKKIESEKNVRKCSDNNI